jgi:hypothetical protein
VPVRCSDSKGRGADPVHEYRKTPLWRADTALRLDPLATVSSLDCPNGRFWHRTSDPVVSSYPSQLRGRADHRASYRRKMGADRPKADNLARSRSSFRPAPSRSSPSGTCARLGVEARGITISLCVPVNLIRRPTCSQRRRRRRPRCRDNARCSRSSYAPTSGIRTTHLVSH